MVNFLKEKAFFNGQLCRGLINEKAIQHGIIDCSSWRHLVQQIEHTVPKLHDEFLTFSFTHSESI